MYETHKRTRTTRTSASLRALPERAELVLSRFGPSPAWLVRREADSNLPDAQQQQHGAGSSRRQQQSAPPRRPPPSTLKREAPPPTILLRRVSSLELGEELGELGMLARHLLLRLDLAELVGIKHLATLLPLLELLDLPQLLVESSG